jgi:hypothetical protein
MIDTVDLAELRDLGRPQRPAAGGTTAAVKPRRLDLAEKFVLTALAGGMAGNLLSDAWRWPGFLIVISMGLVLKMYTKLHTMDLDAPLYRPLIFLFGTAIFCTVAVVGVLVLAAIGLFLVALGCISLHVGSSDHGLMLLVLGLSLIAAEAASFIKRRYAEVAFVSIAAALIVGGASGLFANSTPNRVALICVGVAGAGMVVIVNAWGCPLCWVPSLVKSSWDTLSHSRSALPPGSVWDRAGGELHCRFVGSLPTEGRPSPHTYSLIAEDEPPFLVSAELIARHFVWRTVESRDPSRCRVPCP